MTHITRPAAVRITGTAAEQTLEGVPALGEERIYVVTATCRGHRSREVDGHLVVVADMTQTSVVERPTPPSPRRHSCGHEWCQTLRADDPNHWGPSPELAASMAGDRQSATDLATGVMIRPNEAPSVWIHLSGNEFDVDTYMTHDEAVEFLLEFETAVVRAREAAA